MTSEKLGKAGVIKEMNFGTSSDKVLLIQECEKSKAVTVLIRGGSRTICDEAKRCLFDALCVVRNMIKVRVDNINDFDWTCQLRYY